MLTFVLGVIDTVLAVEEPKWFLNSKMSYDIYLGSYQDNFSVIADVEILRIEEIYGRRFLVIRPAEFTLNVTEGFVLFEAVKAILPNRQLRIQNTNKIKVRY